MKNTLFAFLTAAFFACCIGCGPSGTGGPGYPYATEWNEFLQAKEDKNQQLQIDALQKILDKDPEARSPNMQPVKNLLKFAKENKLSN
ncbi:MAG: hypothetical protein MK108_01020 [Mariniblastus sp.]|nr:hypothetical protein [Mariniblastus sp.]